MRVTTATLSWQALPYLTILGMWLTFGLITHRWPAMWQLWPGTHICQFLRNSSAYQSKAPPCPTLVLLHSFDAEKFADRSCVISMPITITIAQHDTIEFNKSLGHTSANLQRILIKLHTISSTYPRTVPDSPSSPASRVFGDRTLVFPSAGWRPPACLLPRIADQNKHISRVVYGSFREQVLQISACGAFK